MKISSLKDHIAVIFSILGIKLLTLGLSPKKQPQRCSFLNWNARFNVSWKKIPGPKMHSQVSFYTLAPLFLAQWAYGVRVCVREREREGEIDACNMANFCWVVHL